MTTTLYVKEGRRYRALLECDERVANALPEGSHLVQVKLHGRTVLHRIDPDWAAVLAVLQTCEDGLIEVIRKASESHLEQRPLTPGELKAFEDWKAATGNRTMKLLFPSALSIFEALRNAVVEGAKLAKAPPCRSRPPVEMRDEWPGLTCDRPKGHEGDCALLNEQGLAIAAWPKPAPRRRRG